MAKSQLRRRLFNLSRYAIYVNGKDSGLVFDNGPQVIEPWTATVPL